MKVYMLQNVDPEILGFLPSFLDESNPESAREQLDGNYVHGGGWRAFDGFVFNPRGGTLKYPGDPMMKPIAFMKLREEYVYFYECAWVCIVQPSGKYEVARMD